MSNASRPGHWRGIPIRLLTDTIQKLSTETNTAAAAWFTEAITKLG
ncbi:hypothetical protein XM38_021660 [Halomicronema hongdechloris C2206]|uniref:Uncharacterized protein n=1 Tax=Halomicronema hongdechloris C2206 TaxID=1641165 RepID=A0A1Z3HLN7_9CYAN|nr:hypothetical protein [Halomicronema hongdechloris]ASC71214.1 hypothetical protein XM38_021660 [Halomicronema hongdechloris C2206]